MIPGIARAGIVLVRPNSQFIKVHSSTPKRVASCFRSNPSSRRFLRTCSPTVAGIPAGLTRVPLKIKTLRVYGTHGKKATRLCPCGYLGATHKACRCTPDQVSRYQGKLSGPLLDRIDLHVEVPTLPPDQLLTAPAGESTEAIRQRCEAARDRAIQRQGKANHALQGKEIDVHAGLEDAAAKFLNIAAARLGWSARSTHRVLKVARTIADLAGAATTQVSHVAEAVQYRRALNRGG